MKKFSGLLALMMVMVSVVQAQQKGLVNTARSAFAKLRPVDLGSVQWTKGFWAERFQVCRDSMVPNLWRIYTDANISHAYKNFEIAAGLDTGVHKGPSFHDGDFYKTLEAVASLYASTHDPRLDKMMDEAIATIARSQRADGYIYTKAMIEQRKSGVQKQFEDRLSFEAYNIGHLMTAACVHYRATGKSNLMEVAKKATEYLYQFYQKASPTLARNAICPSHYMGVVEMYRTTGEPRYLELAKHLIDIKGKIDDGTDDNQDRIPFRQQTKITGHAVRANYLYAGVADLYAEDGDTSLLNRLNLMWNDLVQHKMYITGGCGSLYDGVSPDGTVYNPAYVQKIHQAFGRDFQLPNLTAHNETCANIGNVLWNWRMLQITGEARYADIVELALYNSVLSGISLNGKNFLYTNPLAFSDELPFQQRWSKDRVPYISLSNCCPPNVVRTVAEVSNYAYSFSEDGLYVNLYGGSNLAAKTPSGTDIGISQVTDYPWDGNIKLQWTKVAADPYTLHLRIPCWASDSRILVNGQAVSVAAKPGTYAALRRTWKKGDEVQLLLPMKTTLMEANPLVEETRNQVTVKRGPVVYCLESKDLPAGTDVFDLAVSAASRFTPVKTKIGNSSIVSLEGKLKRINSGSWSGQLYRELPGDTAKEVTIRLVPYYAWGNRGHSEMTVWLPVR